MEATPAAADRQSSCSLLQAQQFAVAALWMRSRRRSVLPAWPLVFWLRFHLQALATPAALRLLPARICSGWVGTVNKAQRTTEHITSLSGRAVSHSRIFQFTAFGPTCSSRLSLHTLAISASFVVMLSLLDCRQSSSCTQSQRP